MYPKGLIRLQYVLGRGLTSSAIAWFSQGHLSHVDSVLPDGRLLGSRSDVCRGVPAGVQIRPPFYCDKPGAPLGSGWKRRVVVGIPCSLKQQNAYYDILAKQIGKKYDKLAIFGFAIDRDWRDDTAWFCEEVVSWCCEQARIHPPLYLPANKITPVAGLVVKTAVGGKVMLDVRG